MKNHLKRIAAPKSWPIRKKERKFIVRPFPGAHSINLGIPIEIVLKHILKLAKTRKETRNILHNKEIFVNGKRIKENRFIIGLMDVLSISSINKFYRILITKKGKIILQEIKKDESQVKLCRIVNKKKNRKDVIQLNLSDGRNVLVKEDNYKTKDSLLIGLPKQEIKDHISLKKKNTIFLIGGRYIGEIGIIEDISQDTIRFKSNNKMFETSKDYAFVVGRDKPIITIK